MGEENKKSSVETWKERPRKMKSLTRNKLKLKEKPRRKGDLRGEMERKAREMYAKPGSAKIS